MFYRVVLVSWYNHRQTYDSFSSCASHQLDDTFVNNLRKCILADWSASCSSSKWWCKQFFWKIRRFLLIWGTRRAANCCSQSWVINQVLLKFIQDWLKECLQLLSSHNTNGHFIHIVNQNGYVNFAIQYRWRIEWDCALINEVYNDKINIAMFVNAWYIVMIYKLEIVKYVSVVNVPFVLSNDVIKCILSS